MADGQEEKPQAEQVDDGVVQIGDEGVPAVGRNGRCEEVRGRGPGVVADDNQHRRDTCAHLDGAEDAPGHPWLEKADPGRGEQPGGQPVVDQAVGVAEIAGLPQRVQEVEEEDATRQDAHDVQGEGVHGGCERMHERVGKCSRSL